MVETTRFEVKVLAMNTSSSDEMTIEVSYYHLACDMVRRENAQSQRYEIMLSFDVTL